MRSRIGLGRGRLGGWMWRMAYTMAAAASSPGMIESRMALRTPTRATRPRASSGPPIAPRLSMARSNP